MQQALIVLQCNEQAPYMWPTSTYLGHGTRPQEPPGPPAGDEEAAEES